MTEETCHGYTFEYLTTLQGQLDQIMLSYASEAVRDHRNYGHGVKAHVAENFSLASDAARIAERIAELVRNL